MANMTRLQGVNRILMNCGVRPVSALDTGQSSEASDAERILDFESRSAQVPGLYDNRIMSLKHVASAGGDIILGSSIIGVKAAGPTQHRHFSMRLNGSNMQVFDLDRNSFTFTASEEIYLDLTFEIAFEDAAPSFQEVVLKAATEVFQRQFKGNPAVDAALRGERVRAEFNIGRAVGQSGTPRDNPQPFALQQPQGQGG